MKYGNLHFLWFLWMVPALFFFYVWAFKRKRTLIHRFVEPELRERLLHGVSLTRQKFKACLLIFCCLLAIIALIRPKWGFHWEEVKRRGVDIIIALDVSKSMLAEDVSPNRMERAKREIMDLLSILHGDRVGLVAFAGTSFLQSPLTLDYGAVQIFLDDLDTDLIPVPGTAIGEAIRTAIKSFDPKDKNSRVLILITDGEDHAGKPVEAATEAHLQKIKIYTIGIGKEGGAPIPAIGGGFKKNRQGEVIITHLDEESLQKIALTTGGSYVRSITGDLDLEKIYGDIKRKVEDKELQSGRRKRFEERFQWPLLLALILLFLESFYSERKRRKRWRLFPRFFKSIWIFLFVGGAVFGEAQAGFFSGDNPEKLYADQKYGDALKGFTDRQIEEPDNYDLKYNMANTYYKMKRFEEAEKLFSSVAVNGESEVAEKAHYNLGNVAYRLGKLPEAVEHYKRALEINPDDQDAKFNLEFVREEIKKRIEENKKRQKEQKKQQQKKQKQDKSCQNKKQKQDGKQDQNKNDDNQNKDNQNKKEQQKMKEEKEDDKKEGQKGKEDKKDKEKDKENQQQGHSKMDQKKMTKEEAERWLSTLDDQRKKHLKKQMKGRGRYQTEKDW